MAELQYGNPEGLVSTKKTSESSLSSVGGAGQSPNPHHHQSTAMTLDTPAHNPNHSRTSVTSTTSSMLTSSSSSLAAQQQLPQHQQQQQAASFTTPAATTTDLQQCRISHCPDPAECLPLASILQSFNAAVSEDQAWALIHQSVLLYRDARNADATHSSSLNHLHPQPLLVPTTIETLCLHKDGSVHIDATASSGLANCSSQRNILFHLGNVVFRALDPTYYNAAADFCMAPDLEAVIKLMAYEDDEGIGRDADDEETDEHTRSQSPSTATTDPNRRWTQHLDQVLEKCTTRIQPNPRAHYRAVCRALATECRELRSFLQKMGLNGGTTNASSQLSVDGADSTNGGGLSNGYRVGGGCDPEQLRLRGVDVAPAAQLDLLKLGFSDWTRFWVQVVDELRQGVRLKKNHYTRPSQVFELTPYEILMADIRSRNFELRKVMVNGEVPARDGAALKSDAHAVILEFIRSRPPLRKAADRKLAPAPPVEPTPRELLLESIRRGQSLSHVSPPQRPELPKMVKKAPAVGVVQRKVNGQRTTPPDGINHHHPKQRRLIAVDMSLFDDDDDDEEIDAWSAGEVMTSSLDTKNNGESAASVVVHRRKKDIDNQPPEKIHISGADRDEIRTSLRRHTIVGCHTDLESPPPLAVATLKSQTSKKVIANPNTRSSTITTINPLNPLNSLTSEALAEWTEETPNIAGRDDDSLSTASDGDDDQQDAHMIDLDAAAAMTIDDDADDDAANNPIDATCINDDRLTLSLQEIVHIRNVMTKAELEGLPVGVKVKEEVERKKVCFLCLRTRFTIFGQWGVQCKLCQRTVCSKCYSKMRIPTEHFRNVPVMLLSSGSLVGSPVSASPSHISHHRGSVASAAGSTSAGARRQLGDFDDDEDAFPSAIKTHHHHHHHHHNHHHLRHNSQHVIGSAPTTPRKYKCSTPGSLQTMHSSSSTSMTMSMTATASGAISRMLDQDADIVEGTPDRPNARAGVGGCSETIMSRSMDGGPRSLPHQHPHHYNNQVNSPQTAAVRSHPNTLDRQNRFARAFNRSAAQVNGYNGGSDQQQQQQRDLLRGELTPVCNDCRDLVNEIIQSSKQTRSSARNRALRNMTLDLSPVYKGGF